VIGSRLDVDAGTGYEALVGLIRFAGHEPPGDYDVAEDWFDRARAHPEPALRDAVEQLCGGVPTVFGHLLGLARRADPPRDVAALEALVSVLPAPQLRLELLGSSASTVRAGIPPAVLERAANGDAVAVAELLAAAAGDTRWTRNLHAVLDLTPERTTELTLEVLRRWTEAFADLEADLAPRLEDQAARWRDDAERLGWRALLESATGGIVVEDDLPADRVLLVPTVLGAPWVYSTHIGGTKIFCCPVQDEPELADAELVRLLRALGDETRLAILRHVVDAGSATLAEITATMGMSKSALHKHLVLLRSVGLLGVRLGQDRRYVLRDLPDLTGLVAEAVTRGR
jgi:DNA-binding transcriptional ArsR family regulator